MGFDFKFLVMKLRHNNAILPNVVLDLYIPEYILMNILLKCVILWHIVVGRYTCILVIQTAFLRLKNRR